MIDLLATFIILCIIALLLGFIGMALNFSAKEFWVFARTDTGSLILSLITFALIALYYVKKKDRENK